jgi:Zn-dependent peptidase ImmA (M78 family)/DNA-binding XRE family transcriptional regulator
VIYGNRIRQAREYCGLTQTELARKVGVNQSAIAHIESGRNIPTNDLLFAIAKQTGFMASFFERESTYEFPLGTLVFRARNSLTAKEISQAHQHANVLFEHVQKMAERFNIPDLRLPITNERSAKAAAITRAAFGISPDTPIRKVIINMEKNGVFVLALPLVLKKIDAFSTWVEVSAKRPVIAISSGRPSDRIRFSVAHELGHLIMHKVITERVAEMEKEADKFAAAFLLPEKAMRREILSPVTLTSIARLKLRWGVSMQALIRRASELGIITDRQYRYLFEQLSQRGWRTQEPSNLDYPEEKPHLVIKMIEKLYGGVNDVEAISKDIGLSASKTIELLDANVEKQKIPVQDYQVNAEQLHTYSRN